MNHIDQDLYNKYEDKIRVENLLLEEQILYLINQMKYHAYNIVNTNNNSDQGL